MKLNKLILALSCLLTVPAFGGFGETLSKYKKSAVRGLTSGLNSAKTTVTNNPKRSAAIGLGTVAALGGAALYYKYSDKVNAKIKKAAQKVKETAGNLKKRFVALSPKAKAAVVAGTVVGVAATGVALDHKYGKQLASKLYFKLISTKISA